MDASKSDTDVQTTAYAAYAMVMALATALHQEGVMPVDRFIRVVRTHALELKAHGAEIVGNDLLAMAAALSTGVLPI